MLRPLILLCAWLLVACGGGAASVPSSAPASSASVPAPSPSPGDAVPQETQEGGTAGDEDEEAYNFVSRSALGHIAQYRKGKRNIIDIFDAKGSLLFSIEQHQGVTFDSEAKLLYGWSDTRAALYEVPSGKKLTERAGGALGKSAFMPDGKRIVEIGEGIRFINVPALTTRFEKLGGHSEYHQTAKRAFVLDNADSTGQGAFDYRLFLIDIDKEKVIASVPMPDAVMTLPRYAFSANGQKLAWALAGASVWDATTNKIVVLENGEKPEHERYFPDAPYFTADGNTVCITQSGATRAISIKPKPKGTARHCFYKVRRTPSTWIADASTGDIEAMMVDIPIASGASQPMGLSGLNYEVETEALSWDSSMIAVLEQKETVPASDRLDTWVVIAETSTGRLIKRVPVFSMSKDTHQLSIDFSSDGTKILMRNGDTEQQAAIDVSTGKVTGGETRAGKP